MDILVEKSSASFAFSLLLVAVVPSCLVRRGIVFMVAASLSLLDKGPPSLATNPGTTELGLEVPLLPPLCPPTCGHHTFTSRTMPGVVVAGRVPLESEPCRILPFCSALTAVIKPWLVGWLGDVLAVRDVLLLQCFEALGKGCHHSISSSRQ